MKKFIAAIISAVLLFSVCGTISGCKKKDSNVVRIARWSNEADEPRLKAWTAEFEKNNPDIKIEWEFKEYGTHFSTMRNDLIGESAADIIFLNNWGLSRLNLQEKDKKMFVDFSKVEELKETRESIMPSAKDKMKIGDAVIGMSIGLVTRVPVINATIWENVSESALKDGIPYNRTEAFTGKEFVGLMKSVGADQNILMGLNVSHNEALHMFLGSVGAPMINQDGTIGCNNEAGWKAAQQFKEFVRSGWVVPYSESGGGTYGSVENAILNEKCLAGWGNFATLTNLSDYYKSSGTKIATIAPFKAEDITLRDGTVIKAKDIAYGDYNALVVPSFSKNQEKAFRIIKWMLTKEQQLKYAKIADIPVNAEAFGVVSENSDGEWDPMLYSSYKIGLDNLYVAPITSSEFTNHFSTYFSKLCNDASFSGKEFCAKMAEGAKYL